MLANLPDAKIILISDFFYPEVVGGAELTTDAIFENCPISYCRMNSRYVTMDFVEKNSDKYWILTNISQMPRESLITLVTDKVKYSLIHYDYFFCKYRSQQLHKMQTGVECDCHKNDYGRFVYGLYKHADYNFFMSIAQMNEYKKAFPTMNNWNQGKLLVQGSTFSNESLSVLEKLKSQTIEEKSQGFFLYGYDQTNKKLIEDSFKPQFLENRFAVLKGNSWIKNQTGTELYCKQNNIKYDIIGDLPPPMFLIKLSAYKGLVFRPSGLDTAPRLVIEAAALGLELDLNDNVQIKYEDWLAKSPKDLLQYLRAQKSFLWSYVKI